jgi:hypothetical protein
VIDKFAGNARVPADMVGRLVARMAIESGADPVVLLRGVADFNARSLMPKVVRFNSPGTATR